MKRSNIPHETRIQVRQRSRFRCGYCQFLQRYSPAIFQLDHYIPVSKGGTDAIENLWLVCGNCNNAKSDHIECFDPITKVNVPIFNPHTDNWHDHFKWDLSATVIFGKTPVGRGTAELLKFNDLRIVAVRCEWVAAGWHPPKD